MPTVNSDVHMMSGLQSAYDSMQSHDTNTLYFCTDTQRYFIGDVEYSRPVQFGTSLPSTYLPPNSLFYNTNTRQLFFSKDGASWQVISSIPSINGVELNGNLTSSDLDLEPARLIVTIGGTVDEPTSDKTYEEILEAYDEGRNIVADFQGTLVPLAQLLRGTRAEFSFTDLPFMQYVKITINTSNVVTVDVGYRSATNTRMGGVKAANYNEDNYSSSQIAIDSNYFLHAPKTSINGIELTNSTTAENLNLKRADFIVNVTPSGSSYIADKTFEEINAAIDSGNDCICYFTLSGETLKIPYAGTIGASSIVFQEYFPTGSRVIQVMIDSTNAVTYVENVPFASFTVPGVVKAYQYNDATHFPDVISIDYSSGFLHAPKSIFTVTVLENKTANMTFEQIQTAYNKGYYVQALYEGRTIPLVQLTESTAYFRLFISEDTTDANVGMVYDIQITSTSVNASSEYMRASSTQYGLIRADSDTYDETYTKECKMNHADGKLYCQPTTWSFWD